MKWILDPGWLKSEIVLNLTAGTAIVSIAAYMVGDEPRIDKWHLQPLVIL